ncbi:MAG: DUF362 domain-containing protein [Actinobacteria bacterium]|nr:DUF362 domain-containing protein [Actinomycetota bacterium]
MQELDRRRFLGKVGAAAAGLGALYLAATIPGCGGGEGDTCPVEEGPEATPEEIPTPDQALTRPAGLVVVKGSDPAAMLRKGLEAWGGLGALNLAGRKVLIKVNAAFARAPEDAATTNPELLAEAVRQLLEAGAAKVTVYDHILQDLVDQTLEKNGIGPAARAAGAELAVYAVRKPGSARMVRIPGATALPSAGILEELFASDVIVNMPKVKHHSGARLSMAMKNLIGTTQNMGNFHNIDLHQAIAEINTVVRPALVIADATTILLDNGPGGPGTVAEPARVVIGTDPVAIDSYCCSFFGVAPSSIGYLAHGERLGVGTTDFNSLGLVEVSA